MSKSNQSDCLTRSPLHFGQMEVSNQAPCVRIFITGKTTMSPSPLGFHRFLPDLQSIFELVRGLIDLTPVPCHTAQPDDPPLICSILVKECPPQVAVNIIWMIHQDLLVQPLRLVMLTEGFIDPCQIVPDQNKTGHPPRSSQKELGT